MEKVKGSIIDDFCVLIAINECLEELLHHYTESTIDDFGDENKNPITEGSYLKYSSIMEGNFLYKKIIERTIKELKKQVLLFRTTNFTEEEYEGLDNYMGKRCVITEKIIKSRGMEVYDDETIKYNPLKYHIECLKITNTLKHKENENINMILGFVNEIDSLLIGLLN